MEDSSVEIVVFLEKKKNNTKTQPKPTTNHTHEGIALLIPGVTEYKLLFNPVLQTV